MNMNQNWTDDGDEDKVAKSAAGSSAWTGTGATSGAGRSSGSVTGTSSISRSGGGVGSGNTPPPEDEEKKKKKGVLWIVAGVLALLLLGGGGFGIYSAIKDSGSSAAEAAERDNMMALIQRYINNGEYDRALDLLEDLLIKNANDPEALALLEDVMARMALEDTMGQDDFEDLLKRLIEGGALGGIEGLEGISGMEDLKALIEAANCCLQLQ